MVDKPSFMNFGALFAPMSDNIHMLQIFENDRKIFNE